jgi:hypothetical protein
MVPENPFGDGCMNADRRCSHVIGRSGFAAGLAAVVVVALGGVCGSAAAAEKAPEFMLYDTDGQPVSLKGYRGAVVFLTFGATW